MIYFEMDITALLMSQLVPIDGAAASVATPEEGFAAALTSIQSGAPPGVPPPPNGPTVGEEVAIIGPNAQTPNPDFLPQTDETAAIKLTQDSPATDSPKTEDKGSTAIDPADLALLVVASATGSAFQVPVVQSAEVEAAPGNANEASKPMRVPNDVTERTTWIKHGMPTAMEGSEVCVVHPDVPADNIKEKLSFLKVESKVDGPADGAEIDLTGIVKLQSLGTDGRIDKPAPPAAPTLGLASDHPGLH